MICCCAECSQWRRPIKLARVAVGGARYQNRSRNRSRLSRSRSRSRSRSHSRSGSRDLLVGQQTGGMRGGATPNVEVVDSPHRRLRIEPQPQPPPQLQQYQQQRSTRHIANRHYRGLLRRLMRVEEREKEMEEEDEDATTMIIAIVLIVRIIGRTAPQRTLITTHRILLLRREMG